MFLKSLLAGLLVLGLGGGVVGCAEKKEEGAMEKLGKEIDKGMEKMGEKIEEAGEKVKEATKN